MFPPCSLPEGFDGADLHHAADLSQGRFGAVVLQRFHGSLDLDDNRRNAYVVQIAPRDVGAQGSCHPVVSGSRLTPVFFWVLDLQCKARACCVTDSRLGGKTSRIRLVGLF